MFIQSAVRAPHYLFSHTPRRLKNRFCPAIPYNPSTLATTETEAPRRPRGEMSLESSKL